MTVSVVAGRPADPDPLTGNPFSAYSQGRGSSAHSLSEAGVRGRGDR
jgi:hypothetical protein